MSNIFDVTENKAKEFELIEKGEYDASLMAFIALGTHDRTYQGKSVGESPYVKFVFELLDCKDSDGNNRVVTYSDLTVSISPKSNLCKLLKSMKLISAPTQEEFDKIFKSNDTIVKILGTKVNLDIDHFETKDGKVRHFIDKESVRRMHHKLESEASPSQYDAFLFTFKDPDIEVFKNKLTFFTRQKIMDSKDAKKLPKEFHEFYITEVEEQKARRAEYEEKQKSKSLSDSEDVL